LREAITHYRVLKKFNIDIGESIKQKDGKSFSYMALFPKTGRTHQLRVHMKYLNHPIVGDSLYGGSREMALGFKRLALHARKITFKTPDGKEHQIEAPFPKDFQTLKRKFDI
jgi:23S rRNA pseudouridine1911/1915/1917 synthase